MTFFYYLTMVLFIFICLFLMLLVLVQKGRGGGLVSAFGGGGGHTPFGTKTGDVLTWATSIVFGIFLLLAIVLNLLTNARTARAQAAETQVLFPGQTQGMPGQTQPLSGQSPVLPAPSPSK